MGDSYRNVEQAEKIMSEWSHLPNAKVIDALIVHLNATPDAWNAARDAVWSALRSAAWDAACVAVWSALRSAAWDAAWDAARGVLLALVALVAYDDCAHILDLSESEATTLGLLGNNAAVLLLPVIKSGFKYNQ